MRNTVLLAFLLGCACTAAPPPAVSPSPQPPREQAAPKQEPEPMAARPAPIAPLEVPPPPAECARFAEAPRGCAPATNLIEALARALDGSDVPKRDNELACLETSHPGQTALLRALRAELAPIACADVLVTPLIESPPASLTSDDEGTLMGLFLAARLNRLVSTPPSLAPPFDKARFLQFFESTLRPWMIAQAKAVGQLSLEASRLRGYGKGVAAIEAAMSDLRFVQAVRAVPLPTELDGDPDVKNVYYAALDEALEPRKARGRDAALVGLRVLAELGVLSDSRVERGRALLSELYAGSRVNALDALLLPEPPPLTGARPEQRLARQLPTYYAARLQQSEAPLLAPALLRDYLERGLSPEYRSMLSRAKLDPGARLLYARYEVRRGQLYFSGPAFARAEELLAPDRGSDASAFLGALATALASAPKDMAELMLATSRVAPFARLEPLDAIAKGGGRYRGEAAFDSAYIRSLAPPENDATFWQNVAKDFARAATLLRDPLAKKRATEHADAAEKTARALAPAR